LEFEERQLKDTWFARLNLSEAGIESWRRPTDRPLGWVAAVNDEHKILFTQLLSSTSEMREYIYYYLVAIGKDVVLVEVNEPKARILPRGAYRKFSASTLRRYANAGAMVATVAKKPFSFVWQWWLRRPH